MEKEAPLPAALPSEIAALAEHVLGSADLVKHWLQQPALALDGQLPINLMASEQGRKCVRDLLLRLEYGVYT